MKNLPILRTAVGVIAIYYCSSQAGAGSMVLAASRVASRPEATAQLLMADYAAVKKQVHIAHCVTSKITMLGPRLCTPDAKGNCPAKLPFDDSGDSVAAANGIPGVSYDRIPALEKSRLGDKVSICLDNVPINCPPGDDRGYNWTWKNLRTGGSWSLPDSEHRCGGA